MPEQPRKKIELRFARVVAKRRIRYDGMRWGLWEVWENTETRSRDIMRRFLHNMQSIPTLPKGVVQKMLQRKQKTWY